VKIYPEVVDCEEAANNFTEDLNPYNLLPEWELPVKNKVIQFSTWFLGFALLVLTVLVLIFPVWNERQEVELFKYQLKQLEKDAHLVQSRQLEIDDMVDETVRLIKSKNGVPSLLELINLLSQLIQDDTWLTHLKYNDTRLQIQGQSPTASALIGVLESSSLFSNARFVSPLTQDKKTGLERFQISVDVNAPGADDNE
ncbi:MAG: PilN domain-containing protein, partial [Methylococcales bacterium]|nr:PilN domain-containing protein [Methylococcales bacterium]